MIHLHNTAIRNACPLASDPRSTVSTDVAEISCPSCRLAVRAQAFGEAETAKSIPAVTRRMPLVAR